MSLPMTYSRRKRIRQQEGQALSFRNDVFSQKLLQQLFHILDDIRTLLYEVNKDLFKILTKYLVEELGRPTLGQGHDSRKDFFAWWTAEDRQSKEEFDLRIDCLELAGQIGREWTRRYRGISNRQPEEFQRLMGAMNARMMEDGFGFQFAEGQIVEITSEHTHQYAILPVLGLLRGDRWATANEEFRDALMEFRNGNYPDCIADCGNAFESTIKIIAKEKGWTDIKPSDRAGQLIEATMRHQLFPPAMQDQFSGLKQIFAGIATVRNNNGGHGQGADPKPVPRSLASYQLNQTAAAILFLAESASLS